MSHRSCVKTHLVICILFILLPFHAAAAPLMTQPPEALSETIDNLLAFAGSDRNTSLDMNLIPRLLDFVEAPKQLGKTFPLGDRNGASSDYYEFTINRSFADVIGLVFHPDLPSYITIPSSVRRSHWISVNGKNQSVPILSLDKISPAAPLVIKGLEFIENSPDTNSGAYYAYHLQRALILMMHQGRRVLISISTQPDKSEVGKKGVVLGNDTEWNYLYTGEKGTTLSGLGWADTYIYGSDSIMIYYERGDGQVGVKCGAFKWISAGWWGMNFARSEHVRRGVKRFAKDFCAIIESPKLTDIGEMARMFQKINSLSINELRKKSSDYFNHLKQSFGARNTQYQQWFAKLFKDQSYLESLSREEMQALISIEYLKYLLGKPHYFDMGPVASTLTERKPS